MQATTPEQNKYARTLVMSLMQALEQLEPAPAALAKYLLSGTHEETRRYFLEIEGFNPLIIQVDQNIFAFDLKDFPEIASSPLLQHGYIKINNKI